MYRILIVDDSVVMRKIIKKNLANIAFEIKEIFEANNGKEGLKLLTEQQIDLVFVDLNMPEMTGDEMVEFLQKDPTHKEIPVIFISSESHSKRIKELTNTKIAVIQKPFTEDQLKQQLQQLGYFK